MASNERINARRAREEKKNKRNRTIVWTILAIICVALLIMKVCEIDFKDVKNRFTDSEGKFTLSATADVEAYPYMLDSSKVLGINMANDRVNVLTDSSLTVINPADAKVIVSFDHGYAEPIISRSGNYFCMIDQGGTRLRLDTNNGNKYESKLDNPILTACVAKNGNVAYVTKSDECKSLITIVSSSLKKLGSCKVNDGYVTDIAIDPSGKRIAYVMVNSSNAKLVSKVAVCNVGDHEPKKVFDFKDTNILDLHYSSSNLFVVGDDSLSIITSQRKMKAIYEQGTICTKKYCYTNNGELLLDHTKYEEATANTLSCITTSGKVRTDIKLKSPVVNLSTNSNKVVVLFSHSANVYSVTSGEKKMSFAVADGTSSALLIGSNLYVQHGQMLDIKEQK